MQRADLIRNGLAVDDRGSKRVDPDRRLQRRSVRVGEANAVERDHELFRGLSRRRTSVGLRGHVVVWPFLSRECQPDVTEA